MKTVFTKVSADESRKNLKQFTIIASVAAILSLFVWLAAGGAVGAGIRALILSYQNDNKKRPDIVKYRIFAGSSLVVGIIVLALGFSN